MEEKRKNVLVTGACGQLGRALRAAAAGSRDRFIFTDISSVPGEETVYLDVCNTDAVRLVSESEEVDIIVNCAAYTQVDAAEDAPEFADALNHLAVRGLAELACARKIPLVHISTDYVFSGQRAVPIRETDHPDPLNVYGATKLAGEKAVLDSGCKGLIVRSSWLFSPYGKNFVRTMLRLTEVNAHVDVVCDQVGSPTSAASLASFLLELIDGRHAWQSGIVHYADAGAVSWFDFARAIIEESGHKCEVRPCLTRDYHSRAARPHYSVLDTTWVRSAFGVVPPYWRDELRQCLSQINNYQTL